MVTLLFFVSSLLLMSFSEAGIKFKVASFEYRPSFVHDGSIPSRKIALQRMAKNIAIYSYQARDASKQGAQLIVFPEDGIHGVFFKRDEIQPYLEPVPDVVQNKPWVPCTEPVANTEILHSLSCMALNNSIVVVANMGDIKYCSRLHDPHCPQDGRYQYNTDVVFDSDGTLIARYHKEHLYHEKQYNTPNVCEFVTFTPSFGVRFGICTCFDMLFKSPAVDLVEKYGVSNIIVPVAWPDAFPVLTPILYHQAWSWTNKINLITANLFLSSYYCGGSGHYAVGEVKAYTTGICEFQQERLLVSTMVDRSNSFSREKITNSQVIGNLVRYEKTKKFKQARNPALYKRKTFQVKVFGNMYTLTKLEKTEDKISICADKMCCHLDYNISSTAQLSESFAFGVFQGNDADYGYFLEVCVIFKCESNKDQSCGKEVSMSTTVFQSFKMAGNFSADAYIYPSLMSSGNKLAQPDSFYADHHSISSSDFGKPLLTAVLVGRDYSKDKIHEVLKGHYAR